MPAQIYDRWPEVTNPRAREILAYVAGLPGCNCNPKFFENLEGDCDFGRTLNVGANWELLFESDIADRLLNHPNDLPNPQDGIFGLDYAIFQLFRPRNTRHLVQDIALNLSWYHSPNSYRRRLFIPDMHLVMLILGLISGILFIAGSRLSSNSFAYYLIGGIILSYATLIILGFRSELYFRHSIMSYGTKASLLYHYLLQEYSDTEDDS